MKFNINEIERIYPNWYDNLSSLSYEDQKWIWENLEINKDRKTQKQILNVNENVNVNGSDTAKQVLDPKVIKDKLLVIEKLKRCTYKTPIFKIAELLEDLFLDFNSKRGHWGYVAEKWSPKSVNFALKRMTILHGENWSTIQNPAAYFTSILKYYKKRKLYRRK